jgi:predicted nucleotidyltransferase
VLPSSSLFRSDTQARLLGLLLLNPDRPWTAAELVRRLAATPVTVHRELHRALEEGIITREGIGRTFLYRAATDSPLYEPLVQLLERTVGVEAELRRVLNDVPGVDSAFIHGSSVGGAGVKPTSDVDVLVIGTADPHTLRRRLRQVEHQIGREIDVTAYTPEEFAELARHGNSFAQRIIRGPVLALVGSPADLPDGA